LFSESKFLDVVSQEQSSKRNEESISEDSQSETETVRPSTSKQVESKSSLLVSEPDLDANRRRSKRIFAAKSKPAQAQVFYLKKNKIIFSN
jgi:hypothetical protein